MADERPLPARQVSDHAAQQNFDALVKRLAELEARIAALESP